MKNPSSSRVLGLTSTVLSAMLVLVLSGCNDGAKVSVPMASITPISSCVVDSENDVEVGGTGAPTGCTNVILTASSTTKSFGEIEIGDGGTLTITGRSTTNATLAPDTGTAPFPPIAKLDEICIDDGGKLLIGEQNKPITAADRVELTFAGDRHFKPANPVCKGNFKKGILVNPGATLLMYGAKGVPSRGGISWTTLAAPAGSSVPGAKVASTGLKTLHLTADVTKGEEGWLPGDWIVVATTNYVPFDSEFVQIDSVTSNPNPGCADSTDGCSTVTLKQPLKYYHFGSLAPSPATATCADPLDANKTQPAFLCDGPDRNYGVDERAEVGLISRDITLSSAVPSNPDSLHWGGEIMIHKGFKQVAIQGVRLEKFGKDQLGSYPIHFHLVGDATATKAPLIDADSVDHSYNKCVTIHSTSNLEISNLVCARIVGHIFYEELESANVDNPGDDSGIVFDHDLGIGSMSNSFDINPVMVNGTKISRQDLIDRYWWTGDYMTNDRNSASYIGYDGFNIPDTDNQAQASHGFCWSYGPNGYFEGSKNGGPPCTGTDVYIEPASGFWIQNPGTVMTDDAIAGCQGNGRGVWWVPPNGYTHVTDTPKPGKEMILQPLGTFKGNRVSGCYSAYFGEGEDIASGQLFPHKDGINGAPSIIATLDDVTATHNRFRAVWLRPTWFVIKDGHFADNNRSVTLVTSGGIEGNAPGVWELLEDSVLVGLSRNNIGRWGPCPATQQLGPNTGWQFGCIDATPALPSTQPHSGELNGKGYPWPAQNSFGYMLYDGPVRVFHDRFVNYNYDNPNGSGKEFSSELDNADLAALDTWQTNNAKPYEGDAALGWFPANQSAYPTATASKELMWLNTNLRHQIYTEHVKINDTFGDSDKNTAIIDEDGTLDGLGVQLPPGAGTAPVHPISLNNLPFNATSNAVDECLSRGGQNEAIEGRDTSLMSPASVGTLEFSNLYPWKADPGKPGQPYPGWEISHWQKATFTRDDKVPDGKGGMYRPSMYLYGRAGRGLWEPKVSSGYGYTVAVAPATASFIPPDQNTGKAGIWNWIDVGVADVVDPNINKTHPFYIQLGINYTDANGNHPPNASYFMIKRGYKTYKGGLVWEAGDLLKYWTNWPKCQNIDGNSLVNIPWSGDNFTPGCPAGPPNDPNYPAVMTLHSVASTSGLMNKGTPVLDAFYYNPSTGYLYLNIAQEEPNPIGPAPVGSCNADGSGNPACPDIKHGETYYACPKNGCIIYTIALTDDANYTYTPGASVGAPLATNLKPAPSNPNQLVVHGTNTIIQRTEHLDKQGTVYYTATNAPACTTTQPPQP
ncbi:MAG: hypothetical protein WCB49_02365 [Gammaproteobacteria bacterium]